MDGTRVHDFSPYENGFAAGYAHDRRRPLPEMPAFVRGERDGSRWRRGLQAGLEARARWVELTREKMREEVARLGSHRPCPGGYAITLRDAEVSPREAAALPEAEADVEVGAA